MSDDLFFKAEFFLRRALYKAEEATYMLSRSKFLESIMVSRESMHLSVKVLYLLITGKEIKGDKVSENELNDILERSPKEFKQAGVARLAIIFRLWRIVDEFPLPNLGVDHEILFKEEDAELALKHARECYNIVSYVMETLKKYEQNSQFAIIYEAPSREDGYLDLMMVN